MKLHFNTMVKDEEDLLQALIPIWNEYPIDKFVFYDDGSKDSTVEVIRSLLPESKVEILNDHLEKFSESHNRSRMFEYSRKEQAEFVFSIDADELMSANFFEYWTDIAKAYEDKNLMMYWYNVVENSLGRLRQDPAYQANYRSFVLPVKNCGSFDLSQWKYHTPRTPSVFLSPVATNSVGVIHLQAINRRYYALKQLWYKHHEFVNYGHSVSEINGKYDGVVNGLIFNAVDTPEVIIKGLNFDASIYDKVEKKKGYRDFVLQHLNPDLITFGHEYVTD